MENIDKIIEFAPVIIVLILYIRQNNLFVKPEQLEKKHREILGDIRKNFVELNAYKEFQNHIYSKLDELTASLNEIKGAVMQRRKNE